MWVISLVKYIGDKIYLGVGFDVYCVPMMGNLVSNFGPGENKKK